MRVLLVDDAFGRSGVSIALKSTGAVVDRTDSGEEALELARHYDYDIVVLDMAQESESHAVVRRMRSGRLETPVIMLSGLCRPEAKVKAFAIGVDDCLTKPFDDGELIARIHAVVRRTRHFSEATLRVGPLQLNLDSRLVMVDDKEVRLTGKEYSILELLVLRKGAVLTKEAFLNHLYGGMDEPEAKIIDVFICKLRKKLAQAGADGLVATVWGRGYALREPASTPIVAQTVGASDARALVDAIA
jgi:two-component system cell cycle response regulator CtrA